ncbi:MULTISPECIES: DUF1499 domain-containing protein [unclassified Photobacterium]|uniref:DUF1499 domain-containing protein n=1 Tax=unclassified Photobacterium TaxID=2628852 RepID=UPI001EE0B7C8|nr:MULTISPECIES: DUF1499 domain-containing protein [unclassified Photobacterium]MCG3862457.1 DUF1499 domain-containing protein [Photobacterium sp. Ph6]MCG3874044.1 DUF1499 domain-containing protein [Photobacterium sp. Ph5]
MLTTRLLLLVLFPLVGCSDSNPAAWQQRINQPCGKKPNCVSTQDQRDDFTVSPFTLTAKGMKDWQGIKQAALSLPGTKITDESHHYLHVEATSKIFRFTDDLEIKQVDDHLNVRSASRVGYSDFGVNRKRVEAFRNQLIKHELIKQ